MSDTRIDQAEAEIRAAAAALDDARTALTDLLDSGGHSPVDERRLVEARHGLGKAITEANSVLSGLGFFTRRYPDERS